MHPSETDRRSSSGRPGARTGRLPLASEPGTVVVPQVEEQTKLAPPWNVIVHDDPVTLMEYVVMVLRRIFGFDYAKARRLMLEVHTEGRSVVWTGAREQAELYVSRLHAAQLLATMEPTES